MLKVGRSLTMKSWQACYGGRYIACFMKNHSTITAPIDMFFNGHTDEKHTGEGVVNQFIFLIMLRMSKGVDLSVSAATKVIHDAAMKASFDFDTSFADVRKDMDDYLELEETQESKVKHN